MSNKKVIKNGIALPTLVFVVFLTLKLAEVDVVAKWSWWWVCSPLWLPLAMGLVILIIGFIGVVIYQVFKK